jgi:hypothetical protein
VGNEVEEEGTGDIGCKFVPVIYSVISFLLAFSAGLILVFSLSLQTYVG